MNLRWKYFNKASELTEYIRKCNIKRENIQGIFLTGTDCYELFYWV